MADSTLGNQLGTCFYIYQQSMSIDLIDIGPGVWKSQSQADSSRAKENERLSGSGFSPQWSPPRIMSSRRSSRRT